MPKIFTPDDLKAYYPGNYDSYKFAKNGKGEWVIIGEKSNGVIASRTDANGNEYPEVIAHKPMTLSPGMGAWVWVGVESIKGLFRGKKKTE